MNADGSAASMPASRAGADVPFLWPRPGGSRSAEAWSLLGVAAMLIVAGATTQCRAPAPALRARLRSMAGMTPAIRRGDSAEAQAATDVHLRDHAVELRVSSTPAGIPDDAHVREYFASHIF